MPFKVFAVNEILTSADVNDYIGEQVIATFAGTAERGSAIGTPVAGQFAFLTDTNTLTYYNAAGTAWEEFSAGGGSITIGTAAPDAPEDGALWWDSDNGNLYIYYTDADSSQWVAANGPQVIVSTSAPAGYQGQLWFDSTDGKTYIYYDDGTSGQWVSAIGGSLSGNVIQVVSTTKTDTFSASGMASGAATPITGLSASITPRSTSSKILVSVQVNGAGTDGGSNSTAISFRVQRDGTTVGAGDVSSNRSSVWSTSFGVNSNNGIISTSGNYLDSPSTTSSVTYTVDLMQTRFSAASTMYVNRSVTDDDQPYAHRAASTITVMEIAG